MRYNLLFGVQKIWIFANFSCFQAEKQDCSQPDSKNRFATIPLKVVRLKGLEPPRH